MQPSPCIATGRSPPPTIDYDGTDLAHAIKTGLDGQHIGNGTVAHGDSNKVFDFALIEPAAHSEGWSPHLHDAAGRRLVAYSIAGRDACCGAP